MIDGIEEDTTEEIEKLNEQRELDLTIEKPVVLQDIRELKTLMIDIMNKEIKN